MHIRTTGLIISALVLANVAHAKEDPPKQPIVKDPPKVTLPQVPPVAWPGVPLIAGQAARDSIRLWIAAAEITNARCEGSIAIISAGNLHSVFKIDVDMKEKLPKLGISVPIANAIANATDRAWNKWASNYEARNALAFPPFAAYPVPFAPDHPAPPHPLALGSSAEEGRMAAASLATEIRNELGTTLAGQVGAAQAIQVYAVDINAHFTAWKLTTMVANLWGGGASKLAPAPGAIFGTVHGIHVLMGPPF